MNYCKTNLTASGDVYAQRPIRLPQTRDEYYTLRYAEQLWMQLNRPSLVERLLGRTV